MKSRRLVDITNGKTPRDLKYGCIGVYALFHGSDLVYVGKSNCLRSRLSQHLNEKTKRFNRYQVVILNTTLERMSYPEGCRYLDWVEAWEICRSNPPLNRARPNLSLLETYMSKNLVKFCRVVSEKGSPSEEDFTNLRLTSDEKCI